MQSKEFVDALRNAVIYDIPIYKDLFISAERSKVKDPYWKAALALFDKLDNSEREILFSIIKQIQVDTLSNVLGIIDGSSFMEGYFDDLVLISKREDQSTLDGEIISGDLQGIFLNLEDT
jgi:hypothetical protein